MKLLPKLLLLVLAASTLALQGCATRDPRDAPWDPRPESGVRLHDVLPNWDSSPSCRPWTQKDGTTLKVCGGRVVGRWGGR